MKLNDITRIFTKELIEATEQQNLKSGDNEEAIFAKNFEQKSLINKCWEVVKPLIHCDLDEKVSDITYDSFRQDNLVEDQKSLKKSITENMGQGLKNFYNFFTVTN